MYKDKALDAVEHWNTLQGPKVYQPQANQIIAVQPSNIIQLNVNLNTPAITIRVVVENAGQQDLVGC